MTSQTIDVSFSNRSFDLAGQLHVPEDFDERSAYPAVVIATPGSSVKEQIGANYGRRLAARGFLALAFDPGFQGQSGGEPRDLEDPAARVEDIRVAVDYLTTLQYVDAERIGGLGICAGGGYAVNAAMTEHRIKALGTVVPVNIGRAFRQSDTSSKDAAVSLIEAVGQKRTLEAHGGDIESNPWIPDTVDQAQEWGVTDVDVLQAVRFYRTSRGYNENSTNRRHFKSDALILAFDGAGHYEMYDEPTYVDEAVDRLDAFYSEFLVGE